MTITIPCGEKSGHVTVPSSKSWAHRMLITAALSANESEIICDGISKDISATIKCLNGLGAEINTSKSAGNITVIKICPVKIKTDHISKSSSYIDLFCGESGSTLRFLIPVVGAIGANTAFHMEGRLADRPLGPLIEVLSEHGMCFKKEGNILYCSGQLENGTFNIPGNISSQYISGLLMALPLLSGNSSINITGTVESADYIEMTAKAVESAGIELVREDNTYNISGNQEYTAQKQLIVEKDWSSAAFPLCMGAFSEKGMTVDGLNIDSVQGDKEIISILKRYGAEVDIGYEPETKQGIYGKEKTASVTVRKGMLKGQIIDASGIPDLVPIISVLAAGAEGDTRIIHAERLRLKESDRLQTTAAMLKAIGACAEITEDGLLIRGKKGSASGERIELTGGTVDSFNDHRIAMSAAAAASICKGEVVILGAECTDKSFPDFWKMMEEVNEC